MQDLRRWLRGPISERPEEVAEVALGNGKQASKAHAVFRAHAHKQWRAWAANACEAGAGAAHRWSKQCPGAALGVGRSPQEKVEHAMDEWK